MLSISFHRNGYSSPVFNVRVRNLVGVSCYGSLVHYAFVVSRRRRYMVTIGISTLTIIFDEIASSCGVSDVLRLVDECIERHGTRVIYTYFFVSFNEVMRVARDKID
jgi:hypothetical protein